jgi:hypothetical protein
MSSIRSSRFQLGLMFATTLSLSVLLCPLAARAYTADEQQACSGDAFRLCSAEIPDVERVTVCMVRHKSQLSPACRVYFRPDAEERPEAAGRPLSIRPSAHRAGKPHKKPAKKHH